MVISDWIAALILTQQFKEAFKSHWKDARHLKNQASRRLLHANPLETAAKQAIALFAEEWNAEIKATIVMSASLPGFRDGLKKLIECTAAEIAEWMVPETKDVNLITIKSTWTALQLDPLPPNFDWSRVARNYGQAIRKYIKADTELRAKYDTILREQTANAARQSAKAGKKTSQNTKRIAEAVERLASAETRLAPFATVPEPPVSFIPRLSITRPIIKALLSPNSRTIAVTAINGMGGIGKTVIANEVCWDKRIRKRFPDGIFWLRLGGWKDLDPAGIEIERANFVRTISRTLGQQFDLYDEAAYRTLLKGKSVLVVLDDVWNSMHINPFVINAGSSRLIYTSRDLGIARNFNASDFIVDKLGPDQDRLFLAMRSGFEGRQMPEPEAGYILTHCKGLILGLAMIGGVLNGRKTNVKGAWTKICEDLRKGQLSVRRRPDDFSGYETLHSCIAASVNALEPMNKSLYLKLAVLLEDMPASSLLLRVLWGEKKVDVAEAMDRLVDCSLATRDLEGNIHLHDFQLDFVRGEYRPRSDLNLLHSAILSSLHVIRQSPDQFATQMTGRLLSYENSQEGIAKFLDELNANDPRPRLRLTSSSLKQAGGPLLRVHENLKSGKNDGPINAVALRGRGRYAILGLKDSVRIWDIDSDQTLDPSDSNNSIQGIAISADERRLIYGCWNGVLEVWDRLTMNRPERVSENIAGGVLGVALSANGERAVSGSTDGILHVWDLKKRSRLPDRPGHEGRVEVVALDADGKRALSGSWDCNVRVWDLNGDAEPIILSGHGSMVNAAALSANGERAITGDGGGNIFVWDIADGVHSPVPVFLAGPVGPVRSLAISDEGDIAIFCCAGDKRVRVLDLRDMREQQVLERHTDEVLSVAINGKGSRAVSGSKDGTACVWDLESTLRLVDPPAPTDPIQILTLCANGSRAVCTFKNDNAVRIWNRGEAKPHLQQGDSPSRAHSKIVSALAISGNGMRAASVSDDGSLIVWNLDLERRDYLISDFPGNASSVALSATGDRGVYAAGGKMYLLDPNHNGRFGKRIDPPSTVDGIVQVAMSGNGDHAISVSRDGTLCFWDLTCSDPPRVVKSSASKDNVITLSFDGKRAAYTTKEGILYVWEPDQSMKPRPLNEYRMSVFALRADGRRAVSGSDDGTVRVWNLESSSSKCLSVFTGETKINWCSWGGQRILAGDSIGVIHEFIWEE